MEAPPACYPPANVLHPHAVPCFSTSCFQNLVLLGKQVTRLPESPQVPRPISLSLFSPSLGIDWTLIVLWKHCFSADHWVTLSSIPRFPQGGGWLSILLTSYCLSLAIALHPGVKIPFPLVIIVSCCLSNLLISLPAYTLVSHSSQWPFLKYISWIMSFFDKNHHLMVPSTHGVNSEILAMAHKTLKYLRCFLISCCSPRTLPYRGLGATPPPACRSWLKHHLIMEAVSNISKIATCPTPISYLHSILLQSPHTALMAGTKGRASMKTRSFFLFHSMMKIQCL